MGIRQPLEDFVKTTLASLPGYWQKLLYMGELREDGKQYDHWGMQRRHGQKASLSAMGAAHTDVFVRILRTPLRSLLADLKVSADIQGRTVKDYLDQLWQHHEKIVPSDPGGGSKRHFDLTVKTMESLLQAQAVESPTDGSPPPPPGQ